MVTDRRLLTRLTTPGALRVPEITVYFWVIKALSTALGESTSDYLVHAINPVAAVGLGFVFFVAALVLQFSVRRYIAWTYWLAVVMVGVFGTMAADVLHVGFGVPYIASSILYAVVLAAVFVAWGRTERTLSIHSIDTPRREAFYWLAVVATFAMGTALGDLTAITFHLGYLASAFLFAGIIAIPALGFWLLRWNAVFSFWFAYVATRPLGASFADWLGKPHSVGGLGLGDGPVALVLALAIFLLVAFLAVTHRDVQRGTARRSAAQPARPAQRGPHSTARTGRPRPRRARPRRARLRRARLRRACLRRARPHPAEPPPPRLRRARPPSRPRQLGRVRDVQRDRRHPGKIDRTRNPVAGAVRLPADPGWPGAQGRARVAAGVGRRAPAPARRPHARPPRARHRPPAARGLYRRPGPRSPARRRPLRPHPRPSRPLSGRPTMIGAGFPRHLRKNDADHGG